jgi:hypothetical protein
VFLEPREGFVRASERDLDARWLRSRRSGEQRFVVLPES